jgi:hypothetical protein
MPERIADPDYPAEAAARKVRSNGEIKWRGDLIAISTALIGETVAIEEIEDGRWLVRFYAAPIGLIDPDKQKTAPCPPPRKGTAKPDTKPKHERLSPMYPVRSVTHLSAGRRPSIRWTAPLVRLWDGVR